MTPTQAACAVVAAWLAVNVVSAEFLLTRFLGEQSRREMDAARYRGMEVSP